IAGIDTPEIKGKCQKETALAMQARNLVRRMLGQARRIDLLDVERGKYFRIVAKVVADGNDIGHTLIDRGMAVAYDGGKKVTGWCAR
ncbi:MAG TPA: thermonuclease family protein, partial [Nitrospirales bacterium]|nr:thermonuclease family protein [Nitrospirales bacterium]